MDTIVQQVCLALMLGVSFVRCEPALSNQYGVPGNFAGNNNRGTQGANGNGFGGHGFDNGNNHLDQDYVDNQPKSYEFGYAVKDAATGNDFGRRETSDGETVRGEYRVQLPDGRTQIVSYTADWRTGFHAEVRYEGTAVFPEQYNNNNNNNNNNGNNGNQGYAGNNVGQGYDFQGSAGGGYNGGNNGGYNNYRPAGGNSYNNNNNGNSYPYQQGSNSLDSSYNFGARNNYNTGTPSPTYGPAFH